jgi:hypothetical protein
MSPTTNFMIGVGAGAGGGLFFDKLPALVGLVMLIWPGTRPMGGGLIAGNVGTLAVRWALGK